MEEVVREPMGVEVGEVTAATGDVESWGPVNTFPSQLQQQDSVTGGITKRAMRKRSTSGAVSLGQTMGKVP